MKSKRATLFSIAVVCVVGWLVWPAPQPTLFSLRIGSKFEEVIRDSSYPVEKSSKSPRNDEHGFGYTLVTEPAVVIQFNDPQYGFTLPPTTFAAVAYRRSQVATIRTSPSLRTLSFPEAVTVLGRVQTQLQKGDWLLANESRWIDLSPAGTRRLYDQLNGESSGHMHIISTVAPGKYFLYLGIRRAGESLLGFDRYLVELSIGVDYPGRYPTLPGSPPLPMPADLQRRP